MGILQRVYNRFYPSPPEPEIEPAADAGGAAAPVRYGWHDGEKFPGGFGFTELLVTDYWTLRARSVQLFRKNIYARGLLRRMVTNIINTGLALEAEPDQKILGLDEKKLHEWADVVENRFHLWERWPELCDHQGRLSFGALQAQALLTALISGDVLVTLLQDPATGLPRVRLVDGSRVQTPFGAGDAPKLAPGHEIRHGVELDANGRHVAYWIVKVDTKTGERRSERLAAVGPETGRRQAWLVYGTDKLLDEVRGEPMLAIILQSLQEIDRYRDATLRKAVVNSIVAMFIKKEQDTIGSRPLTGGAIVRGKTVAASSPGQAPKVYKFAEHIPGAVLDELAPGESPQGFPATGTDEKFADFESAIIYAIAWAHEVPPEILTLSFASNYSASQAAINEFKLYLNVRRSVWGDDFCQPIYVEWLLSESLAGRVTAPGLLESWREPSRYDRFIAWVLADWTGAIKPSVDLGKQAEGYGKLIELGLITRARAAREVTGTKYSKNVAQLERENEQLNEANAPLAPPAPEPGAKPPALPDRKPPPRKAALAVVESSE